MMTVEKKDERSFNTLSLHAKRQVQTTPPRLYVLSLFLFEFRVKKYSAWAAGQRIVTPNSSFRRRPTSTPNKAWRFTQGRRQSRRSINYSDVGEDTLCHDEANGGSEDELDSEQYFFPWDDETTMFSDLIDDV